MKNIIAAIMSIAESLRVIANVVQARQDLPTVEPAVWEALDERIDFKTDDYPESLKAALVAHKIFYYGQLVTFPPKYLLEEPGVGKQALNKLRKSIINKGLKFGTDIEGWDPPLERYKLI